MDELRELRDIAVREHGPQARSTWLIEEAIRKEAACRQDLRDAPQGISSGEKPR
jgi:hypothetical protein